ncbi:MULTISPECIES: thioesterase II family protein [Streptomyces]|uniref:thioesterase II family protein n=1 Tax=Streptomyces TaxID=1883 RepID=UPI0015587B92|nr:thioesterase [Streptomyces kasugaensis]
MSKWVRRPARAAAGRAQLWCFHYAGGGASAFRQWTEHLPDWVDVRYVQLPGRENRYREPAYEAMAPLVKDLADELAPQLRPPFTFFGHSMGARVSFALAHELAARGLPGPAGLVLSGTPAPSVTDWRHAHHLGDEDLIEHLRELGGVPAEILRSAEILHLMLPVIRSDLKLSETSDLTSYPRRLDCPVLALAGAADAIAPPEKVDPWGKETDGPYRFEVLPGGHFFLQDQLRDVVRRVLGAMRENS